MDRVFFNNVKTAAENYEMVEKCVCSPTSDEVIVSDNKIVTAKSSYRQYFSMLLVPRKLPENIFN